MGKRDFFFAKQRRWYVIEYEGIEMHIDQNPKEDAKMYKVETVLCTKCRSQFSIDLDYKPYEWRLYAFKCWLENHECCIIPNKTGIPHIVGIVSNLLNGNHHTEDTSH